MGMADTESTERLLTRDLNQETSHNLVRYLSKPNFQIPRYSQKSKTKKKKTHSNSNISSSFKYGWQNLPDLIFSDIVVMVERGWLIEFNDNDPFELELNDNEFPNLQKCRQVCRSWNALVSQMTKLKRDTIRRRFECLAANIREDWVESNYKAPCLSEISDAAGLAHHGMLGSVEEMCLQYEDLASVPAEHLASLASCVTGSVSIRRVRNCDLVNILDNIKCQSLLTIIEQNLNREESLALVRALETNVREFVFGDVILNITALTMHSGQGLCKSIICDITFDDIDDDMIDMNIYLKELRSWAQRINWEFDEWPHEIRFFRKEEKPGT